jgi:hypothetical protein
MEGVSTQKHVYLCRVYFDYSVIIPQIGWGRSRLRNAWGPMDAASRQNRLSLRTAQTDCGIEGDFGNHDECGERLVGLGLRVEKKGEKVRR